MTFPNSLAVAPEGAAAPADPGDAPNRGPVPPAPAAQWIALSELAADAPPADAPRLLSHANPLHQVRVTLQVRVGEAALSVGELLGAQQDAVLVLDRSIDQPVDLLLEGQVVARGQLVAMDEHFAVRITELPLPLALDGAAPT